MPYQNSGSCPERGDGTPLADCSILVNYGVAPAIGDREGQRELGHRSCENRRFFSDVEEGSAR